MAQNWYDQLVAHNDLLIKGAAVVVQMIVPTHELLDMFIEGWLWKTFKFKFLL